MYKVVYYEQNKIEIALSGHLSQEEFVQVIHQLESLCASHAEIFVLFDASDLEKYDFTIIIDEYDFYKKYQKSLKRLAIVSDLTFETFILKQLDRMSETEFKTFTPEQAEEARKWIFPSKLP